MGLVFRADDAPRYRKGFAVHMALYAIQLITIAFLRVYLVWQNKKKQGALETAHPGGRNTVSESSEVLESLIGVSGP